MSHWTNKRGSFAYHMALDFVAEIEMCLERKGINYTKYANMLGLTKARVSQILNDPSNLTLASITKLARTLGLKVTIVTYDDGDPDNAIGPVSSGVLARCWEKCGKPRDFFDLGDATNDIDQEPEAQGKAKKQRVCPEERT